MIPIATWIYALGFGPSVGPSGVRFPDPGYYFLLSSLNFVAGHPIIYTDNPGTPVQMVGVVAIRTVYALSGSGGIVHDVIGRPGIYIRVFFLLLMLPYGLALAALGYATWRRTGRLGAALVVQAMPHLLGNLECWISPVSAECLLVTVVSLLLVLALGHDVDRPRSGWRALLYGSLIGFGIAVKLTFAPVALVPLLLLGTFKDIVWFATAIVVSFAVSTLPIWSQYPAIAHFVFGLATHEGLYGQGPQGIAPLGVWVGNLVSLVRSDIVLSSLLLTAAVIVSRMTFSANPRQRRWPMDDRLLAGLLLCGMAQLITTAKQPFDRYLLPARATSGLLFWLVVERAPWLRRWATDRILFWLSVVAAVQTLSLGSYIHSVHADSVAMEHELDSRYADWTKVFYEGSSSAAYALMFGHGKAGLHYGAAISANYPASYMWQGWGRQIVDPDDHSISLDDAKVHGQGIVFVGSPLIEAAGRSWAMPGYPTWSPPRAQLDLVFRGHNEAIYAVVSPDQSAIQPPSTVADVPNATASPKCDPAPSGDSWLVNTNADHDDGCCSPADCTLREALNAISGGKGHIVQFAIPGCPDGMCDATLVSPLPEVTIEGVTIDGTTQSGTSCGDLWGNRRPVWHVTIDANHIRNAGVNVNGGRSVVRGLEVKNVDGQDSAGYGIHLGGAGGNVAQCNYVHDCWGGIFAAGSGNLIGGPNAGDGNVTNMEGISGLTTYGDANVVQGNFTGVDIAGRIAAPNEKGIYIEAGNNTLVGGLAPNARNLVSGNSFTGIEVKRDVGISNTIIQNNYIGLAIDGTTHLCNASRQIDDCGIGTVLRDNRNDCSRYRLQLNVLIGIAIAMAFLAVTITAITFRNKRRVAVTTATHH